MGTPNEQSQVCEAVGRTGLTKVGKEHHVRRCGPGEHATEEVELVLARVGFERIVLGDAAEELGLL